MSTSYTILLFGPYADAVGSSAVPLAYHGAGPCTARLLLEQLEAEHPELRDLLSAAMLAVNCRRADANQQIGAADELALIGLVSGG